MMAIKLIYQDGYSGNGFDLYRHFAPDGELLYVGVSSDAIRRLGEHASQSHWYRDIAVVEIEGCSCESDARSRESHAIRSENPKHNKNGRAEPSVTLLSEYIQSLRPGDRLKGVLCECGQCGVWFVGREGALYCSTNCRVKAHRKQA